MQTHDIRKKYLEFFRRQGHVIIPSASLLPENDPTTLFTGSGMQPMISYLLGEPHPRGTRITDSQKCFRAEDIETVGDNRHTTFFEMLGNWSLGDYFQKEQIPWVFTFLTEELGLDPHRLYVTVFRGNDSLGVPKDETSVRLWKEMFRSRSIDAKDIDFAERDGLQGGHIFYYDEKKNWWSRSGVPQNMPEGEPGGPDSEMFWDFGEGRKLHERSAFAQQACHVNCDCGRFLEIGNSVFMAYKKTTEGFEPLKQKNVDFGGGLERIAAALNDDPDMFRIDLFEQARNSLENLSGMRYGEEKKTTYAFRVILDHIRAATFLIADGALPSNKDQGYFIRRLLRRAIRFGQQIHIESDFVSVIAENFIEEYAHEYDELLRKQDLVVQAMQKEEQQFRATLQKGLKQFQKLAQKKTISGKEAFDLFTTYGFPYEITEELAKEADISLERAAYEHAMKEHQQLSRAGAAQKFSGGLFDHSEQSVRFHTATHLLHQALRNVLGTHVLQKGSNITHERMRFDFSHPHKMTAAEISAVEHMVNEQIQRDLPVSFEILSVAEAKKRGAIGVFDERYGDKVKVYQVGDFSLEICGGPHVQHTAQVGRFKIIKEEAVSAGIRRMKAILTDT